MDALRERQAPTSRPADVASMDPVVLYDRLQRAEKERAALLQRRELVVPGASVAGVSGVLEEDKMQKYIEQLQIFGHDGVLTKLQESELSGGLGLSSENAQGVLQQLETVLRVVKALNGMPTHLQPHRRRDRRAMSFATGVGDQSQRLRL